MPNIWTHILFCEEVIDSIHKNWTSYYLNEPYMKLGAQGPDPFFYYNFWPWIKEEPVHKVGTLLHTKNCGPFLYDIIQSAGKMDEKIQAYVIGFITHHLLDRNTHPYIHYRAGYTKGKHQKLEVIIDTLMMEKYHHLKTWKSPAFKEIDVGFSMDKGLVHFLYKKIIKHYPEIKYKSTKFIQKSYRDMKLAQKILADPYGWKNALLKSLISSYSHRPVQDDKDYLNINHTTWYHPATKSPCSKSFIDLYKKSKLEAVEIIPLVVKYWLKSDENILTEVKELLGNISYDTGQSVELNLQLKYSEPIV